MDCSTPDFPVHHCLWSLLSNSCPLSQWCHPTISSSVTPFSSCPQSLPASGSFAKSWLFALCGLSIGASASSSVLLMSIQCWFPLELTDYYCCYSDVLNVSDQPVEPLCHVLSHSPFGLWASHCFWHKKIFQTHLCFVSGINQPYFQESLIHHNREVTAFRK